MGDDDKIVSLQIVSGHGMDKMDPFGLSDPYVKIFLQDTLIGKTPFMSTTLDPVWPPKQSTFPFKLTDLEEIVKKSPKVLSLFFI